MKKMVENGFAAVFIVAEILLFLSEPELFFDYEEAPEPVRQKEAPGIEIPDSVSISTLAYLPAMTKRKHNLRVLIDKNLFCILFPMDSKERRAV